MPYRGPNAAQLTKMRIAYANSLPTSSTQYRRSTPSAPLAQYATGVMLKINPYRDVSAMGESGPVVYTPGNYSQSSVTDLRLLEFGYTSNGTVAPDVQPTDQFRVGSAHYNVLDVLDDLSIKIGLLAVCQRSQ